MNQDNSSLNTMGTDQLLDLFSLQNQSEKEASQLAHSVPSKGLKSMLQGMTELWEESQYDNEYEITNFLSSLAKKWQQKYICYCIYFLFVQNTITLTAT